MLIMRTVNADGSSKNGFVYPLEIGAVVTAPDWNPKPECGGGLHGFPNGEGDGSLANWSENSRWLIIEADLKEVVCFDAKCKFRTGIIRHIGTIDTATKFLVKHGCNGAIIGNVVSVVKFGVATAGYKGTATAGYNGTATAGDWGTATAGYEGTATAGDWGTATAGNWGTATAGYKGTATAGNWGTAIAGDWGTATAGDEGTVIIKWFRNNRFRYAIGYIGEDGLEPNVPYKLDNDHKFVKAN
jgi:hypothetical protein